MGNHHYKRVVHCYRCPACWFVILMMGQPQGDVQISLILFCINVLVLGEVRIAILLITKKKMQAHQDEDLFGHVL